MPTSPRAAGDRLFRLVSRRERRYGLLSFSSRALTHSHRVPLRPTPHASCRHRLFQRPLPTDFTQPPERDKERRASQARISPTARQLNAEFAMKAARASGVFGASHAEALVGVLGEGGMQSLLSTLNSHAEELILYGLDSYVSELQHALPSAIKLPSHQYGAQGCKLFFEAKLTDLANYEELHSGVFHSFRRLGNIVSLLSLLNPPFTPLRAPGCTSCP